MPLKPTCVHHLAGSLSRSRALVFLYFQCVLGEHNLQMPLKPTCVYHVVGSLSLYQALVFLYFHCVLGQQGLKIGILLWTTQGLKSLVIENEGLESWCRLTPILWIEHMFYNTLSLIGKTKYDKSNRLRDCLIDHVFHQSTP